MKLLFKDIKEILKFATLTDNYHRKIEVTELISQPLTLKSKRMFINSRRRHQERMVNNPTSENEQSIFKLQDEVKRKEG